MSLHRDHEFRFTYRRKTGKKLAYSVGFSVSDARWDGSFYYDFDVVRDEAISILHADAARLAGPSCRMEVKKIVHALIQQEIEALSDDAE
ncbi:hypothetical protein [Caballeronia sp. DA-9]|uniref:hypothetical protein n=1 Tax=Caballeronia sp. DA-9 TaxID=3436237 RepID=UPI003F681C50